MAAQWTFCPTHGRLCEVGSPRDETPAQRDWRRYQQATGEIIRHRWEQRELLLLWLGMVEATHRDPFTLAFLTARIRLGDWGRRLIEQARYLAELGRAGKL